MRTSEEILKKKYEHHKNFVKPDDNWANWEDCVKDGATDMVIDAINEARKEAIEECASKVIDSTNAAELLEMIN